MEYGIANILQSLPTTVAEFIWILLIGAAGVIGLFIGHAWKNLEKKTIIALQKSNEIEKNYLARFEEMRELNVTQHERVLEELHQMEVRIISDFVRRAECPFLHEKVK
jgi:hypothetical protein